MITMQDLFEDVRGLDRDNGPIELYSFLDCCPFEDAIDHNVSRAMEIGTQSFLSF